MACLRFAFAGDRDIAVDVLDFLVADGDRPEALLLPDADRASHDHAIRERCGHLSPERIIVGRQLQQPEAAMLLGSLNLDLILGIHFPLVVPKSVLQLPRIGVLNLHPAYLPYNRGWHTPSWAILEGTPYGATLHFMSEEIDAGDIILQRRLDVAAGDTANTLYRRVKETEIAVFREAWPMLKSGRFTRTPQQPGVGMVHRQRDLLKQEVQKLDLDANVTIHEILTKLRALTTNRVNEAAYYEIAEKRYRVQVAITEESRESCTS